MHPAANLHRRRLTDLDVPAQEQCIGHIEAMFPSLLYYTLFVSSSAIAIATGIASYQTKTQRRVKDKWFLLRDGKTIQDETPAMKHMRSQASQISEKTSSQLVNEGGGPADIMAMKPPAGNSEKAERVASGLTYSEMASLKSEKRSSWTPEELYKVAKHKVVSYIILQAGAANAKLSRHDVPLLLSNFNNETVDKITARSFTMDMDTDDMEVVGFSLWSFEQFARKNFATQMYLLLCMNHPLLELFRPPLVAPRFVFCISYLCRVWGTLLLFIVFHNALGQASSRHAPPQCGKAATPFVRVGLTTIFTAIFTSIFVGKTFALGERRFKDARLWTKNMRKMQVARWRCGDHILAVCGMAFSVFALLYLGLFMVQVQAQDRKLLAMSMLVFLAKTLLVMPLLLAFAVTIAVRILSGDALHSHKVSDVRVGSNMNNKESESNECEESVASSQSDASQHERAYLDERNYLDQQRSQVLTTDVKLQETKVGSLHPSDENNAHPNQQANNMIKTEPDPEHQTPENTSPPKVRSSEDHSPREFQVNDDEEQPHLPQAKPPTTKPLPPEEWWLSPRNTPREFASQYEDRWRPSKFPQQEPGKSRLGFLNNGYTQ